MTTTAPPPTAPDRHADAPPVDAPRGPRWREGARELLLVAVLYAGYSLGRLLADDDLPAAGDRAAALLRLEAAVGLDVERTWSQWLTSHEVLAVAASYWYAAAHYAVTPAVLLWLWWCRPAAYARERWPLVLASAAALVVYVALPVAPPRLVGHVDVLAWTAPAGWWSEHASAPAGLGHLTNELAAMPSLHVGWALWVALVVWRSTRRRLVRVLALLHPLVTSAVVVATANHWVVDVLAGTLLVLVVDLAVAGWRVRRARPRPAGAASSAHLPGDWSRAGRTR